MNSNQENKKQKLLKKYGHACALCGVDIHTHPLTVNHLIPFAMGGESSEDNLTLVCANCHHLLDRQPSDFEFSSFLTELLVRNSEFADIKQDIILGSGTRYRIDILVSRKKNRLDEKLLIECKNFLAFSAGYVHHIIAMLEKNKAGYGNGQMVLAVPATLRSADIETLEAADIEVWDLPYLASKFQHEIPEVPPSYYKALFLAKISRPKKLSREEELISSLDSCTPGRKDCYIYQLLVGEILECLFTPPLGKPIPELSDKSAANRRDFIMPNYTEAGFWSFLRQKYEADYIVIDAKNYTQKVKKSEVLQIANYLKVHGAGLFGIIISRKGGDAAGCEHTLREQWLVHRKLILVLDDDDIKMMLLAKSDGRPAEDILGQKIEQFRLSM